MRHLFTLLYEFQSHAVHKETGQTAKFTVCNWTWDLDAKLIPYEDVRLARGAVAPGGKKKLTLCPFKGPGCKHPGCLQPGCTHP